MDEQRKAGSQPRQNNMGLFTEEPASKGADIKVKSGISIPSWLGMKIK